MYKLSYNMSTEKFEEIQKNFLYYKFESMQDPESSGMFHVPGFIDDPIGDRFRQCVTVFQMFRCRLDHYDYARITLLLNGSIPKKDK